MESIETKPPVPKAKRILAVDDDPRIVRRIKVNLERNGYQVETAESGLQALALIEENRPDLIITDLMMPEMSGCEFIRVVRSDTALIDLPILLFGFRDPNTGGINPDPLPRIMADRVILKPFKPDELVSIIEEMLANNSAKDKQ